MIRAACVAALVAGCGRVGFDALAPVTGDGDGGGSGLGCAVGHDEDGDGVDDCADVCPHVADPGQADRDGDGVGDACDPNPDQPIDHIAFFDPFTGPRAEWATESPAAFKDDAAEFDVRDNSWDAEQPFTPGPHTYVVAGHVTATGTMTERQISLLFEGGMSAYYCELYQQTQDLFQITYTTDGSSYHQLATMAEPDFTGLDFRLTIQHARPGMQCDVELGTVTAHETGLVPSHVEAADSLDLHASDLEGRFTYFIDIRTDP